MQAAVVACTSISLASLPALVASQSVGFVYNDLLAHPQYHVRYLKEVVPLSSVGTEALHRRNTHHRRQTSAQSPQLGAVSVETEAQSQAPDQSNPTLESADESAETHHSEGHQHVFSSPASSMIMPDVRGQRWICTIPPKRIQLVKAPPKKTPQEMEEQDRMSVKKGLELLDHLTGHCLRTTHDYWTYEYCHKKHIRQYHAEFENGQLVPASEELTHTLALYQPPAAEIQGHPNNEGSLQQRDSSSSSSSSSSTTQAGTVTELAVSNEQKYLVQQWGQGEICDLTGAPRKVQVRFQCANVDDRIQHVSEPSTCNYIMLIYSPSLCKEVAFENIPAPEVNNIDCRRIVSDDQYLASIPPATESIGSGAEVNVGQHQQQEESEPQIHKQPSGDAALPVGTQKKKVLVDQLGEQDSKQLDQMATLVDNYVNSLKALMTDRQRAGFQNLQDLVDSTLEQLQRSEDEQRKQALDMDALLGLLLGTSKDDDALPKTPEDRDREGAFEDVANVENGPAAGLKNKRRDEKADSAVDEQVLLSSALAALLETLQSANTPPARNGGASVAETRHQGLGKEDEQDEQKKKRL
ncbi:Protein OS-9 [Mortierella alpina]|nr:Protein OS-9 [Mortierella alpina]